MNPPLRRASVSERTPLNGSLSPQPARKTAAARSPLAGLALRRRRAVNERFLRPVHVPEDSSDDEEPAKGLKGESAEERRSLTLEQRVESAAAVRPTRPAAFPLRC